MREFYTEMPVSTNVTDTEFTTAAGNWIRQIPNSDLQTHKTEIKDVDHVRIESSNGLENFEIRAAPHITHGLIGFRYQIIDQYGRRWQTDSVLKRSDSDAWLSIRGRCEAVKHGAVVEFPKSPHFCKVPFERDWNQAGEVDLISNYPRHVSDRRKSTNIPAILLSGDNSDEVRRLANDLSGICEVYYGHTNPDHSSLYFFGEEFIVFGAPSRNAREFIKNRLNQMRSVIATRKGSDWAAVLEAQAREARNARHKADMARDGNSDDAELLSIYADENDKLKRERDELKSDIHGLRTRLDSITDGGIYADVGMEEIFPGERVVQFNTIELALLKAGAKRRTSDFLNTLKPKGDANQAQLNAENLRDEIKKCSKENNPAQALMKILTPLGFSKSDSGPHIKIEPPSHLNNIGPTTLAKTPSDWRSSKNSIKQILDWLGL